MNMTHNPGTILHDLIYERIGSDSDETCQCDKTQMLMNAWGPDGCRKNLDWIVSELVKEARKRKWYIDGKPLLTVAARFGTMTPLGMMFARRWLRALVLEAIERSERSESDERSPP